MDESFQGLSQLWHFTAQSKLSPTNTCAYTECVVAGYDFCWFERHPCEDLEQVVDCSAMHVKLYRRY